MLEYFHLSPLPDELARSYRDRLCRVNGWGESIPSSQKLGSLTGYEPKDEEELVCVDVLAYVARKSNSEFVTSHTMLPLQRAVNTSTQMWFGDYTQNKTFLKKRMSVATRSHFYFCPDCIEDDVREHGAPYWRRRHQIPGLHWCPVHKTALRFIEHPEASVCLPNDVIDQSRTVDLARFNEAMENPFVHRFIEICDAMLDFKQPLRELDVWKTMRKRIQQLRERERSDRPPVKSGMLEALYGKQWLADVYLRAFRDPSKATYYIEKSLDRYSQSVTGMGYALLFAGLFESATEAIALLTRGTANESSSPAVMPVSKNWDNHLSLV